MAVLVTGGAGYIGSHMVWKLLDAGEDVVVLDRLSTGFDWAVPSEAELVVGDIADQELVEATLKRRKVDAIIHFAGSVVVPDSVSDPLGYYLNNTVKSRALIESAVRAGVPHFIFSSTAAVYGGLHGKAVTEDAATAAGIALRHIQADDRTDAARHGRRASVRLYGAALFQRCPAPIPRDAPGNRPRARRT